MANIKTFARIKPHSNPYPYFEQTNSRIYIRLPEGAVDETTLHRAKYSAVSHEFKFGHIFSCKASQDEVFNLVAKGIVEGNSAYLINLIIQD